MHFQMEIHSPQDGMGQLKIVPGGLQLSGQALFLDVLRASSIRSRHGQPITIGTNESLLFHISVCIKYKIDSS